MLPGLLQHLSTSNIHSLLHSLHLSYTAAVEFDRRPGLKFLVQKVAQAERAANLYKLAGASWTLRMVTLFDLSLAKVKNGLSLDEIKKTIESDNKDRRIIQVNEKKTEVNIRNTNSSKDSSKPCRPVELFDKNSEFIRLLSDSFAELCDIYLDLIFDKNGKHSAIDKMSDEPIFFLTIQPDEFPTEHRKSLEEWTKSLEAFSSKFDEKIEKNKEKNDDDSLLKGTIRLCSSSSIEQIDTTDNLPKAKDQDDEPPSKNKPFSLADLVQDYSSDSDDSDDSDCFTDIKGTDSGVASLTGNHINQ